MIINNAPVTIEEISSVSNHPNADRLELARVGKLAYQFVIGRDQFSVGDKVVYIPIDSVLPDDVIEIMGLTGRLAGANKNRVKTVKLRGQISQGLVAPVSAFDQLAGLDLNIGDEVHEYLGIEKYEPPAPVIKNGNLHQLPSMVGRYSLANAQHYPEIVEMLMDQGVCVTEKIEGSNWWAYLNVEKDEFRVGQRNFEIVMNDGETHTWIKAAEDMHARDILYAIAHLERAKHVALRGEIIGNGIQGNIYGINGHEVIVFDIEIDGKPMDAMRFMNTCAFYDIKSPPVYCLGMTLREFLDGGEIPSCADGHSMLRYNLDGEFIAREGIVVKPMEESFTTNVGRLAFKIKSPEYLAQ